jgi:hypothetical protein
VCLNGTVVVSSETGREGRPTLNVNATGALSLMAALSMAATRFEQVEPYRQLQLEPRFFGGALHAPPTDDASLS